MIVISEFKFLIWDFVGTGNKRTRLLHPLITICAETGIRKERVVTLFCHQEGVDFSDIFCINNC
jgi:hypothetical protein